MKLFLDYLPIVVFVGIYFLSGAEKPIYPAVQGLMVASVIQTLGYRIFAGNFEKMHVWTLVITIVFGSLTLFLKNAEFIQWKASIVVWIFTLFFLYRQFISKKPFVQELFSKGMEVDIDAPANVWIKVNLSWPIVYGLFGFINLYVAYNFSEAFWVNFKLFGMMGMSIALLIYTIALLFPYFPEEESEEKDSEPNANQNDTAEKES